MVTEYWVMRVLLHPGPVGRQLKLKDLGPDDMRAYLAYCKTGELTCLPDGCIAEPVEQFAAELDAHAARERLAKDNPSGDYRVVLNTSLDNSEVA